MSTRYERIKKERMMKDQMVYERMMKDPYYRRHLLTNPKDKLNLKQQIKEIFEEVRIKNDPKLYWVQGKGYKSALDIKRTKAQLKEAVIRGSMVTGILTITAKMLKIISEKSPELLDKFTIWSDKIDKYMPMKEFISSALDFIRGI